MGYNIISPNEINKTRSNGLGISYVSNAGQLFRPIYVDIDQALENLKNLLLTRFGERVLQPTFGCRLFEILFQPNIFELKDEIKDIIIQPVNFWLPYITIDEVHDAIFEQDFMRGILQQEKTRCETFQDEAPCKENSCKYNDDTCSYNEEYIRQEMNVLNPVGV